MWTFKEEKYLLEHIKDVEIKSISKNLGKSTIAVKEKMRRLKISKRKKCNIPWIFWNKHDNNWIVYGIDNREETIWIIGEYDKLNDAKEALFKWKVLYLSEVM